MWDFKLEQFCDHVVRQEFLVVDNRYFDLSFPLTNTEVKVFFRNKEVPPDDPVSGWYLSTVESGNSVHLYRITFHCKRPFDGMQYTAEIRTVKEWCPRCHGRGWVMDLDFVNNRSNYPILEYPENYLQQLVYAILVDLGQHPFYPTMGTKIRLSIGRKFLDTALSPEREVQSAVRKYNKVRTRFSQIMVESSAEIRLLEAKVTRYNKTTLILEFFTNLGNKEFGVVL